MNFSITFATLTNVATLVFGVFVGFSFSILFVVGPTKEYWTSKTKIELPSESPDPNYDYYLSEPLLNVGNEDQEENAHALENSTVANLLFDKVKILCCVFTTPKNHPKKAKNVLKTWGSRCNKVLFMSTAKDKAEDDEIDLIALPVEEDIDRRWAKTKESFKYIYENHLNEYDWFLKVFDDTYVILENLRFMLYPYAAETPIYFGCKYKPFVEQGYMTGHASYILSREAVRRFVEVGIPDKEKCRQDDHGFEDIELGLCLEKVHVIAGDSRDLAGKGRFFPFLPERHLLPKNKNIDSWYWKYIYYETDEGLDCCSDNAISYHGVTTNQIDPKFFPDPDVFDPNRFSAEQKALRPKSTFMLFGDGPRVCIGMTLGLFNVKMGLFEMIRYFNIQLAPNQKPMELHPLSFGHIPKHGIKLIFTPRTQMT